MRESEVMKPPCSVPGCDRESSSRGWCVAHYSRWRRTGQVGAAELAVKGVRVKCSVSGCQRDSTSRGMCGMHYLRVLRHGTLSVVPKAGPGSPRWVERGALTYDAAHDRVKRSRGPASIHECTNCGKGADDWAYQHSATEPLTDDLGRPYSDNTNDYAAMCRSCHRAFDIGMNWRQQGGDHLFIVTIEEAAMYAGVATATVRSWVTRGALTPVKANTKPLLFKYDEVAAAQRDCRSRAWIGRHADAVAKWQDACA